jgi:hypothetical protein
MISINFASRNYRLAEAVLRGFIVLCLLSASAMAVIVGGGLSLRREISGLEKKVKDMAAAEDQIRPVLAERERIVRDLNAMSGLIQCRRFSWTQLLTNIEQVSPIGVALSKVDYNAGNRSVSLDGAALTPESLRSLMVGFERTPAFKDAYLKNQSVNTGSIFFNVVAFYQENKAAGVAQRK